MSLPTLDEFVSQFGGRVVEGSFQTRESEGSMGKVVDKKATAVSENSPITRETLEAKLHAYQTSLQIAQARYADHLKHAEAMKVQIQAHTGAIQAVEDLLRSILPQASTGPTE